MRGLNEYKVSVSRKGEVKERTVVVPEERWTYVYPAILIGLSIVLAWWL